MGYPSETQLYGLDGVGNRTGEKRAAPGVVTALTVAAFVALTPAQATAAVERQHNAADWLTAVVDVRGGVTTPLTHDANGNRTTEGTKAFSWDIRDTLTRVQDGATVLGTYDYDASLQRVKADSAQGHVEYVLDGKYVLRETGARSRRYHFSEGEALAVTGVGGGSSQDRWLLIDALGSVVSEANAAGGSVTARQFDAWGNYRNGTAPSANETRLGFTGHQFDVETGLTYARARYYDSKLGVMLSRDSYEGNLADAPSLHRFSYSHNSPLNYRDPTGRTAGCLFGGLIGCVADAVQWNRAFFTWGQDNSANRYVKGDMDFMKGAGNAIAGVARGLFEAQKAQVLGRNADGSAPSAQQLTEGGPLQQLGRTVVDPGYAARKMVGGLPESFQRAGRNWGEGVSALADGNYRRAGELIPFAEAETFALVQGGRAAGAVAVESRVLEGTALQDLTLDANRHTLNPKNWQLDFYEPGEAFGSGPPLKGLSYTGPRNLLYDKEGSLITRPTSSETPPPEAFQYDGIGVPSGGPVRNPNSVNYGVFYEAQLPRGVGTTRGAHFAESNRQLYEAMQADPAFAARMEAELPGISQGVAPGPRGAFKQGPPINSVTWHHVPLRQPPPSTSFAPQPGRLQLMLLSEHTAPGPIQTSLHPGGVGGMEQWGGWW